MFAGGPLGLYELSHALVAGAPLTVFTAKRGVRVELHTASGAEEEGPPGLPSSTGEAGAEEGGDSSVAAPPLAGGPHPRTGVLQAPVRLVTTRLRKKTGDSGEGSSGPVPSELVDPGMVVWRVRWDDGGSGEFVVGTQASHTSLKVGSQGTGGAISLSSEGNLWLSLTISLPHTCRLLRVPVRVLSRPQRAPATSTLCACWSPSCWWIWGAGTATATSHASQIRCRCAAAWVCIWHCCYRVGHARRSDTGCHCARGAGWRSAGRRTAEISWPTMTFMPPIRHQAVLQRRNSPSPPASHPPPHQAALQWHNQLLRELVGVWWSGAPLLLPPGGAVLRPEVALLACQADSLLPVIRGRLWGPEGGQWSVLDCDVDSQVWGCCHVCGCAGFGCVVVSEPALYIPSALLHTPEAGFSSR